ncbi:transcriptional regulatory protein [Paramyrothecium foliicola]|nr:transcriptional regulatory protein [Paramyrothecium foliicola]
MLSPRPSDDLHRHAQDGTTFTSSRARRRRMNDSSSGAIRRIRQACTNCRTRKTKCSGDRPICANCQRNDRICYYEPYINTQATLHSQGLFGQGDVGGQVVNAAELLQRMRSLEFQVAHLSKRTQEQEQSSDSLFADFSSLPIPEALGFAVNSSPNSQDGHQPPTHIDAYTTSSDIEMTAPSRFNTIPPPAIAQIIIENYFLCAHNQPYTYFQEANFRDQWARGLLPRCLIFAVMALSVRFTNHEYFDGAKQEATEVYARESWLSVLKDYMTSEDRPSLHVAQTTNILAIVDFTAGRISSGWLKIGMAVRIAQDLQLTTEPDKALSPVEQEEHRRVFWSIYLLDKLVSCGRGRPPAAADKDCDVQLPCDELSFRQGILIKTPKLQSFLGVGINSEKEPSNFGLTVIAASAIGRCARYVLHSTAPDECPPWDSKSEYSALSSILLSMEYRYTHTESDGLKALLDTCRWPDMSLDHQALGHLLFAHILTHLCYCLLNHPFLLRLRLKGDVKTPPVFLERAFQTSREHALKLVNMLTVAFAEGCNIRSSFYVYATSVAASVIFMFIQSERAQKQEPDPGLLQSSQQALDIVVRMGIEWEHASRVHFNLLLLLLTPSHADLFTAIIDPKAKPEIDDNMAAMLWSILDYGAMCTSPPIQGIPE